MNARRGFFRLWIVFCVLVVIGVGVASYGDLRGEFTVARDLHTHMLPVDCIDWDYRGTVTEAARGTAGVDYSFGGGHCWYRMENFRRLYPEYKELSDGSLFDRLQAKASLNPRPWRTIVNLAEGTIGVLLAVFVLGYALIWAFGGFHSRSG